MKVQRAGLAVVAVAAFLSLPALADSSVSTGTGGSVSSGTGLLVAPASASVTVMPSTSVAVPTGRLLPGGAMVQRSSTTVLGGPAGDVSGSKSVVTDYWVNVPSGAERRDDFQRWQSLK
jgi:hypothetical protein